ncbi:MAG: nitrate/nitrite transporter NrtS [Cyanobacteria bacterium SBLK]|nr:nitrate/nitrite transporter NrtS [Cyanobacteria bacterium SBLK]
MNFVKGYLAALCDRNFAPTGLKVAAIVGSILLVINHGSALASQQMTQERWLSAILTYLVPYAVNIHGQFISQKNRKQSQKKSKH